MKNLIGMNVKALHGKARLIVSKEDEAVVFEKYKSSLTVYVCSLENNIIVAYYSYHNIKQSALSEFLIGASKQTTLTPGCRIGHLQKGEHIRRIIVLRNQRSNDAPFLIKVEPYTKKDEQWTHNGSGWVPVTHLGQRVSGLIVFLRDISPDDLIEIDENYSKEGVYFLDEQYEVYVENVRNSYAFGKLIPRNI